MMLKWALTPRGRWGRVQASCRTCRHAFEAFPCGSFRAAAMHHTDLTQGAVPHRRLSWCQSSATCGLMAVEIMIVQGTGITKPGLTLQSRWSS